MRFLALLFFIAFAPSVIFLAALSYGGISTDTIKAELSKSGLYKKFDFPPITPDYAKSKINNAIDDSAMWIVGSKKEAPSISFKDIKEEFLEKNPDMQNPIDEMSDIAAESEASDGTNSSTNDSQDFIKTIVENDFTYPLKDLLFGLKFGRSVLSILLPALLVLMTISIGIITWKSPDNRSRFRWLGATFLISSIGGYLLLQAAHFITLLAFAAAIQGSGGIFSVIVPSIEKVAMIFMTKYGEFQTFFSFATGVFGVVCVASSFAFQKDTIINKPRPNQKKKSTLSK